MKKLTFYLIAILFLSSCSATWHVNRAKKIDPLCFKYDTTINEIVFKLDTVIKIDTTILVLLPRDTVRIDTVIKELKRYSFKPIYAKNGIITAKVSMNNGILHVSSYLDSTIWYHYKDEILIRDALITKLKTINTKQTITIQKQDKSLKWYQKVLNIGKYVLIGVVALLLIAIVIKLIKWIKK